MPPNGEPAPTVKVLNGVGSKTVALGTPEESAKTARRRVLEVEARTEDAAAVYPNLAEVVSGYVAVHGYNADDAFVFGLDVILDGLERLRTASE